MENVYRLLKKLENEPSTNGKKAIIKAEADGEFLTVAQLALGQDMSFNLTDIPPYKEPSDVAGGRVIVALRFLNQKGSATLEDAQTLANIVGPSEEDREVVRRILRKDLRCGVGAKMVNSVHPGTCFVVPYQRYSGFDELDNVDFEKDEVYGQLKLNGMFAYMFDPVRREKQFLSRNGSSFSLGDTALRSEADRKFISELEDSVGESCVLMGELLVLSEDGETYLSRQEGNGILNKFISGEGDPNMYEKIRYVIWGFVTESEFLAGKSDVPYKEMWNYLLHIAFLGSRIILTNNTILRSRAEAIDFYKTQRSRKEEGAMVKVANKLKWKSESSGSKFGIKLKPEAVAEFEIVDAYYGDPKRKYAAFLGGLIVKSSDGKIVTKVGGGFSHDQRMLGVDWWRQHIGKIVSISYIEIVTDKTDRTTYCLGNSNFVETRFNEKDEADTYEYCIKLLEVSHDTRA